MDTAAAARARSVGVDEGVPAGLSAAETSVLGALEETAVSFELVCRRSGLTLAATAVALERLASSGLAARSGSGWERRARGRHCAAPARRAAAGAGPPRPVPARPGV